MEAEVKNDGEITCNVVSHKENLEGKEVYVVECVELGISDYGDTLNEAMENLKKAIKLLLEEDPEKKETLKNSELKKLSIN